MYKDKKGLWRQQVTINGQRKVFSSKSKKDLMLKIANYKNEKTYHTPKFKTIAEQWQEDKWEKVSQGSIRSYSAPLRDLIAEFGEQEIGDITSKDLQRWFNSLNMAYKSVAQRKSVLSMIYDFAIIDLGMDLINMTTRIRLDSRLPRGHRDALSPDEISAITSTTRKEFLLAPLIYYTGCRCGEALALTYGDIDRKNKTITINKAITHQGNRPVISPPKTEKGIRIVPLLPQLEALLPKKKPRAEYIVSGSEPLTKSALRCRWEKWEEDHGVHFDRHSIRHTYATMLWESGVDFKTLQTIIGHANLSTTMDIYAHMSDEKLIEAGQLIDRYMNAHLLHTEP